MKNSLAKIFSFVRSIKELHENKSRWGQMSQRCAGENVYADNTFPQVLSKFNELTEVPFFK